MTRRAAPARRRAPVAAVLLGVVVAGFLVATRVPGPWGDAGGDVLYAVATYVLVVLVAPATSPRTAGLVALGWCWLVELVQATGLAAAVNDAVPPAAWLLGSTFAVRDLVCYALGVALAAGIDLALRATWAVRATRAVRATLPGRPSQPDRPARTSG